MNMENKHNSRNVFSLINIAKQPFLYVVFIFSIFFSSCDPQPFVSKVETVEGFNASRRAAGEIVHDGLGYERTSPDHYARTYYKYVLHDVNASCPEINNSYSSFFKTESNSQDGPIHESDRCIECGYTWKQHKHRR